jgi:UDP-N-acetylglucosamine 4,6-dehydratase
MKNKKIFITGGAGFLGENIIRRYYSENELTIYSRDEAKHYYLRKKFPKVNCVIGDVRNLDLLMRSARGHQIGIFAASLKQIESVDQNVEESVDIIIKGSLNSRRASEDCEFESSCFISSDKSRAATTLYGSMKFVAGESFIVNAEKSSTRLSCAVYGNVMNSTGSIIPLIWNAIKNNYQLTLFSTEMTRFMIEVDEAIDLIESSLKVTGFNVVPNLKSFRVKDLFEIYSEEFGLKYVLGQPRISEKIHEMMISKEESTRTTYDPANDIYLMHYKNVFNQNFDWNELTSDYSVVTKNELYSKLKKNNFYKND